ncbi:hypothetical protein FB45DRAFT_1022412 [Roridomyces roridus]|uniref:Uncharacterized protein n=1 Tax=Roridomyces roridus TaxID=1738132 RepID=A0AAD7FVP7_9AGAR|nr:hypothetical protein FB45DRAFT_1022412 [Roridomyces roridus]
MPAAPELMPALLALIDSDSEDDKGTAIHTDNLVPVLLGGPQPRSRSTVHLKFVVGKISLTGEAPPNRDIFNTPGYTTVTHDTSPFESALENAPLVGLIAEVITDGNLVERLQDARCAIRAVQMNPDCVEHLADKAALDAGGSPTKCSWCTGIVPAGGMLLYRCQEGCHRALVACSFCIQVAHELRPTHRLEVWRQGEWAAATLRDVEYVYQGFSCPRPGTLIHIRKLGLPDGEQLLWVRDCGCEGWLDEEDDEEEEGEEGEATGAHDEPV